jgi:hypothetical protein
LEIFDHAAVAVQKHERFPFAAFDVMQPDSAKLDKLAGRRIVAFRLLRTSEIEQCGGDQRADRDACRDRDRM